MVEDKALDIAKDFESSLIPLILILSYVIASIIIGLVMSIFTFLLGEPYIVLYGGEFLFQAMLKALGIIVLTVGASSAMVSCL